MINKNRIVWDFHQFLIPSCRTKVEFYWSLILFMWLLFVSFINWMSVKKRSQIGYKETLKNITNDKTVTDYRIWPQIRTLMPYMSINEIYKKTLSRIQIELYSSRFCTFFFQNPRSPMKSPLRQSQQDSDLSRMATRSSPRKTQPSTSASNPCKIYMSQLGDVTLCYVGSRNFVIRV